MKKIILSFIFGFSALSLVSQNQTAEYHHRRSPQRHEHVCSIPPCSPEEMNEVIAYMKKYSFDDERMAAAKILVTVRPMTVSGLEQIAKLFSFDNKRTDFLIFAYESCVDKEHYYKLRKIYTFSSEAENLFKKLGLEN